MRRSPREYCARGTQLPQAKLDDAKVRDIRTRHASGEARHRIASEYGLHLRTIDKICTYDTWKHVRD